MLPPKLRQSGTTCIVTVIDTEPIITGDYLHIESIIKNLFLNALYALGKSATKKIDITISKAIKDETPYLRITVTDTGEGIPADQYEKVFNAFYTTKSAKGTGLGLSIVKRMVRFTKAALLLSRKLGRERRLC